MSLHGFWSHDSYKSENAISTQFLQIMIWRNGGGDQEIESNIKVRPREGRRERGGWAVTGLDTARIGWLTSMSHATSLVKDIGLILCVGKTERLGDSNKITRSGSDRADTNNPRRLNPRALLFPLHLRFFLRVVTSPVLLLLSFQIKLLVNAAPFNILIFLTNTCWALRDRREGPCKSGSRSMQSIEYKCLWLNR